MTRVLKVTTVSFLSRLVAPRLMRCPMSCLTHLGAVIGCLASRAFASGKGLVTVCALSQIETVYISTYLYYCVVVVFVVVAVVVVVVTHLRRSNRFSLESSVRKFSELLKTPLPNSLVSSSFYLIGRQSQNCSRELEKRITNRQKRSTHVHKFAI